MYKRTLLNALLGYALIALLGACGSSNGDAAVVQEQAEESAQPQEVKGTWENVDASSFQEHMSDEGATIIDVRTAEEIAQGMIPGAVQIEFESSQMKDMLNELNKDEPMLVYCAAGGRSGKTMELMKDMGFTKVYNLDGGMGAWQAASMPVETP